jgi:MFS transporter, ACS family, tartrate transporter
MATQIENIATMPDAALSEADAAAERRVFARIAWRILPLLIVVYIFNFIDRTNVAVAALTMNKAIGLSPSQFGTGAGVLFIGYCVFDVPSNLALYRFGARFWLARIMVSWGLVSGAMVFVSGPRSFFMLRFLLGVAEAGFFPGVAFFLSSWFPARYRSRILGWFLVAIPASSLIGAPLSGLLLRLDGLAGLAGWQWVYLLEAVPCVVLGFVLARVLVDHPRDARWLSEAERALVISRLAAEARPRPVGGLLEALGDRRVWILSFVYLGFAIGAYGIQMWLPLIIKQQNFDNFTVGILAGLPYLAAVIGMVMWAGVVDRHGRRIFNLTLTCLLAMAGFVLALLSGDFVVSLLGLTVALVGVNAARAVFWAIPARFLTGIAAAGGIAFINSLGTTGGFIGPALMGWLRQATGSFTVGLMVLAGILLATSLLAMSLRFVMPED